MSAAGDRLGLTRQAIGQWAQKPGAPVTTKNGTTLVLWPAFARWREKELVGSAIRSAAPSVSLDEARTRKALADAERSELTAAKQRNELAPVAEMDAAVERLASAVRDEVRGLRSRFTTAIVGLANPIEAAAVLDQMETQILGALAKAATEDVDEPDGDEGNDA